MYEIQRKLAQIDRQLTGVNLHKRIISTCPLVSVATGLIAGILIQSVLLDSQLLWLWLILLSLCLPAAVLFFVIQTKDKLSDYTPVLISTTALVCFLCLGAIRLISFHQPKTNDIRNLVADESKLAVIRGMIMTEPYVNKNQNWKFAIFKPGEPSSSFYFKVSEVETTDGWAKVAGTVRLYVSEPILDLKAGDSIQAYCRLDRFDPSTSSGQFDTAKYLARKNIFIAAFVQSRDGIKLLQSTPAPLFTQLKNRIRQSASRALLDTLSPEESNRGLLEALLLGYRGNIDSNTYMAFRKTGLLHFISLSGMHLGILIGMVWWLCKTAGLMKPARAVICLIALAVFLLIVPPRAPTLRAAIICCVFCVSFFFRRHSNPLNTLSLAAIILLLISPTHIFEAGWQLSFAAVLAIVLFADRIHFFIYEKVTGLSWRKKKQKTKLFFYVISKPGPYFLRLFSMGLAAWLGGAGILLYHFYTITPLASIWTLLVFPFVSLILILGYLKVILFFLLPTLSAVMGAIVVILSNWLIWIVELIAKLDMSQMLIGHIPLMLVIFYYSIIIFTGFVYFRRRSMAKKVICIVMFSALIVFLGAMKWQRTHRDDLIITFLDVGHGQAILARLPGKANILFDAGSRSKSDIGRRVVNPFLDYNGINKIDAIFISHNDTDHINGIPEVVEHCKVGCVYTNNDFFGRTDQWGTEKYLNDYLIEKGLTIKPLNSELKLSSSADIKILWPNEEASKNKDLGDNDKSQVSLIEFAGKKILLCSDIEKFAQRELLRLYPDLKADIVFVPHHGSLSTLEDDFLKKLDPDILIYSCDQTQYERQSRIIKKDDSSESLYTSKHGTVVICINRNGLVSTKTFVPL
ncbi:MAG: DNA internalization-related competence protein ComEC/Rec2 [Planctomycetes bacterium]|nr:DNA internalization-related competence protein ComEC/Rec2 [Planctomycetota bacterium]MBL7142706.1 DNA internalization-related competence protein ComEC/Rec2 [Phycisphaerae bacterium]